MGFRGFLHPFVESRLCDAQFDEGVFASTVPTAMLDSIPGIVFLKNLSN